MILMVLARLAFCSTLIAIAIRIGKSGAMAACFLRFWVLDIGILPFLSWLVGRAVGYMQMVAQDTGLSEHSQTYLEKAISKTSYLKELSDEFFALSLVEGKEGETPGNGLGLYVVKRIVEKYDGSITAKIGGDGEFEILITLPSA